MSIGPVDIEFVLKGNVDAQMKRVSQTVAGESKALQEQVASFGKTFSEAYDKSGSSLAGMKDKLEALKKIYAELSEEGRKSEFGQIISEQVNRLSADIAKAEGANKSLMSSLREAPGALGSTVTSIEAMTKAALRFIATPLGAIIAAIVVALKTLTAWFKSSEEGENALAQATAIFGQVLNQLLNPVEAIGEWLWKAFTKPKEALKDLVDFLKGQVMNRLDAFGKAGAAIQQIFSGQVKEGLFNLGDSMAQFATGIKAPLQQASGFLKEATENSKKRLELEKQMQALEIENRNFILERAKSEAKISELRFKATDLSLPEAERLKFMQQAGAEVDKLYAKEILLAQKKLDITRSIKSLDDLTKADKEELINMEAEIVNLQGQKANELRALSRQTNSLSKAVAGDNLRGIEAIKNEIEVLNKKLLDANTEEQKQIAERILLLQKELQTKLDSADAALRLARANQGWFSNISAIPSSKVNPVVVSPKVKEPQLMANNKMKTFGEKLKEIFDKAVDKAEKLGEKLKGIFNIKDVKAFAAGVDDVLGAVTDITDQYAEQLRLNEDQVQMIRDLYGTSGIIGNLMSGNVPGAISGVLQTIIGWYAQTVTTEEELNAAREEANRLANELNELYSERIELYAKLGLITPEEEASKNIELITQKLIQSQNKLSEYYHKFIKNTDGNYKQVAVTFLEMMNSVYGESWNASNLKQALDDLDEFEKKYAETNNLIRYTNLPLSIFPWIPKDQRDEFQKVNNEIISGFLDIENAVQEITGTTAEALADGLSEAFLSGEDAAESWGKKVDDIIKGIMIQQLSADLLVSPIKEALNQLSKDTEGGLTTDEAEVFKNTIRALTESVSPAFEAAREALKAIGIETGASTTDTKGMTGAIQNITEETAGLLAGQFGAIRVDIKAIMMEVAKGQLIMDQGLSHLARISANTEYNRKLENIAEGTEEMIRIMKEKL